MSIIKYGYLAFDHNGLFNQLDYRQEWRSLKQAFNDLPADQYAPANIIRKRRYCYGYIESTLNQLSWPAESLSESIDFYQEGFNPDHKNEKRTFATIPAEILRNPLLKLLVEHDFCKTNWPGITANLFKVGLHLIRLEVNKRHPISVSSPDCLHRDGEFFTFAHLIKRKGIIGGTNTIGTLNAEGVKVENLTEDQIIDQFMLDSPLQGYGVYDAAVSHAVESVRLSPGAEYGMRDIVLIDFTPVIPLLS